MNINSLIIKYKGYDPDEWTSADLLKTIIENLEQIRTFHTTYNIAWMYNVVEDEHEGLLLLDISQNVPLNFKLIESAPISHEYWELPRWGVD